MSLIGFSLGSQVIKSCIKCLNKIGAKDIIHQVTFLGGATGLLDKPNKTELWQKILSSQIPGQISNVYTKRDWILILFSTTEVNWALGRSPVFEKSPSNTQ